MCTLGLMLRRSPTTPLVIAANRDESRERPSRAPFLWNETPRWVAGRDELAGGTWLGVNQHGVVVGLTNLWTGKPPDPAKASRGTLVTDLLRSTSLADAGERLLAQNPAGINPYVLVCADAAGHAWWTSNADPTHVRLVELEPGAHAIGNVVPAEGSSAKLDGTARAFAAVDVDQAVEPLVADLQGVLATHTGDRGPRSSVCVHTESVYGTVSASILILRPDLAHARLFHAAGPPCVTRFEDRSEELRDLL